MTRFVLSVAPIDTAPLRAALAHTGAGACACFEGWVRNQHHGREVRGLAYTAYVTLAEAEGGRIVAEAAQRHDLLAAACVHRMGELAVGDLAVWVGVSAAHRDGAFHGCHWIIDEVKRRVPIWKLERYADGSVAWQHPAAERCGRRA